MNRTRLFAAALLGTALACLTCPASADFMYYHGTGLAAILKVKAPGTLLDNQAVNAGQMLVSYGGKDYAAYCLDINHWVSSCEVTPLPISSLHNGYAVAYLFETYAGSVATGTDAAALQSALWEVLFETDPAFSVTGGYFRIDGNAPVMAAANSLLATLPPSYTPTTDLVVLHCEDYQDVLVPEPASLAVFTALGVPLLRRRRRGLRAR